MCAAETPILVKNGLVTIVGRLLIKPKTQNIPSKTSRAIFFIIFLGIGPELITKKVKQSHF